MSSTAQFPGLVMIIRHGEKPGTPADDKDGGPHLSERGAARAAALSSLFTPDPNATPVTGMEQRSCDLTTGSAAGQFTGTYVSSGVAAGQARFPTPNFLFATKQDPPDTGSNRPAETITPLAQALQSLNDPTINSTISQDFTDDDYDDLAKEILGNAQTYGGKVILICWHHGKAPDLAKSLGVPKEQLKKWKPWDPTVFDLIFYITWDAGQANLVVDYQQLLYGDSTGLALLTPSLPPTKQTP